MMLLHSSPNCNPPFGFSGVMLLASVSLMCSLAVGCSEDDVPRVGVSGIVTLDGAPLKHGFISFIPSEGTTGPKAGGQIIDGRYEIEQSEGPVVGQLRVQIREEQDLGFELDDPEAFNTQASRGRLPNNRIPPRYNTNSTLVRTTTADGPNEFDFELATR